MNMNTQAEKLPYDHAKFVDRTREVQLVVDKARRLTAYHSEDKRVIIFHGVRGSGKSWLLQEIEYQLKQELPRVPTIYIDLVTVSEDAAKSALEKGAPEHIDLVELRRILVTSFSDNELRDLCFYLQVDYESLPGQSKEDRARELIWYFDRRGHVAVLVQACYQLRPAALGWDAFEENSRTLDAVHTVTRYVRNVIEERIGPGPVPVREDDKLNELTDALLGDARRMGTLVLLFDHIDDSSRKLLELLEYQCLARLVVLPKVLIILAGRSREYIWKGHELRFKSEERDLNNFDLSCTQEQLEKQAPQSVLSADEIQSLGAGYPWSNYILGISPDKIDALAKCIRFLLRGLPVSDDDVDHLSALCVLRAFNDEMLPPMLAAYFNDSTYRNWRYRQCCETRLALVRTTLVKWVKNVGGYMIDEALSHVLEHHLYEHDQAMWERLHIAARDMFKEWVAAYPNTAARWQQEVVYHDGKLTNGPLWAPPNQEETK